MPSPTDQPNAKMGEPKDVVAIGSSAGGLEEDLKYTKESLQATIQELEASNEELRASNEEASVELARSNHFLEQFAYIVSHDLKAPLRHCRCYTSFLEEAIEADDKVKMREEMDGLARTTQHLDDMINDIITYSRVSSQKKENQTVDLNDLVAHSLKILKPVVEAKKARVQHGDLPTIHGDKTLLGHIFHNLLSNAFKYCEGQPQVEIVCEEKPRHYQISVLDNGIGIDPLFSTRIFEPFKRLVSRDEFEGNGIGLSIAKTAVEQHKGTISVEPRGGKGSCFRITLPKNAETEKGIS